MIQIKRGAFLKWLEKLQLQGAGHLRWNENEISLDFNSKAIAILISNWKANPNQAGDRRKGAKELESLAPRMQVVTWEYWYDLNEWADAMSYQLQMHWKQS